MSDEEIDVEKAKRRISMAMKELNESKIGTELHLQHAMEALGGSKSELYELLVDE